MADNNGEFYDEDIIINDQDGLPNVHPNLLNEAEINSPDNGSDDEFEDLPMSLIVTNIHDSVFVNAGKFFLSQCRSDRKNMLHINLKNCFRKETRIGGFV